MGERVVEHTRLKRMRLCAALGLGACTGAQLLAALNRYFSPERVAAALAEADAGGAADAPPPVTGAPAPARGTRATASAAVRAAAAAAATAAPTAAPPTATAPSGNISRRMPTGSAIKMAPPRDGATATFDLSKWA